MRLIIDQSLTKDNSQHVQALVALLPAGVLLYSM